MIKAILIKVVFTAKHILLAMAFLFVLLNVSHAQTVYIANNNPGAVSGTNVFTGSTALPDAIAAASAGDIIYVTPSASSYGTIDLTKALSIFGVGFNPDNSAAMVSRTGRININASNCRISGITISSGSRMAIESSVNNIMIDKSRIELVDADGTGVVVGNIIFQNNILGENRPGTANTRSVDFGAGSTGVVIKNNLIYGPTSLGGWLVLPDGTSVENNVFIGANGSLSAFHETDNCSIKNNIFIGVQPHGTNSFTGNSFEYNISHATGNNVFSTANGNTSFMNLEGQDPMLTNIDQDKVLDFSEDPTPLAGSPALGNGEGGIDIGVLGGPTPYDLTGTSLPLIQNLIIPSSVAQGDDLNINIRGRGN